MTSPALLEGRLHPITPWRRAWAVACGAILLFFRDLEGWYHAAQSLPWWASALAAGAVSLCGGAYGYASWRATSYRLTGDALHYRSGLLFQRKQRFELAHIQAADIRRPLIGRFLGVCTLRLSVSGESSDLAYLGTAPCEVLLSALRGRMTANLPPGVPDHGAMPPSRDGEEALLTVKPRTLAVSLLLDVRTMLEAAVLLGAGIVPFLWWGEALALVSVAGVLGPVWHMTVSRWPRWHGWTLTAGTGGYRADFGLFGTQHQTFRHQRTQAVILEQPLLWRRRDWVRIQLVTAGYRGSQMIAPVATRGEAEALIAGLWGPDAVTVLRSFRPAPARARWVTPFSRALSFSHSAAHVSTWEGMFLRNIVHLSPTGRIQHVVTVQGPWQRRLGLASVELNLAGGPPLIAGHRDAAEAAGIATAMRVHAIADPEAASPLVSAPGATGPGTG
ncbi:PH domain-containing protein [Streptomyces yaizuensis]|uniref:PH domain-containing protein n=1 Tax=Streptomyces yaizuensis TaxID=2989713 RepID=A0ABQ5P6T1_9ACTN|nr:PH domain-containing protein [Streptomyces sp. YSPA8]GLF98259.1 PH domain-containing protein [Streptomyces sp. YSPA8]